jgi:hypothetical protein
MVMVYSNIFTVDFSPGCRFLCMFLVFTIILSCILQSVQVQVLLSLNLLDAQISIVKLQ